MNCKAKTEEQKGNSGRDEEGGNDSGRGGEQAETRNRTGK